MEKMHERERFERLARDVVKRFNRNLKKTKAGKYKGSEKNSNHLKDSLRYKVHIGTNRRVSKIEFSYKKSGLFVDMGVARSVDLADVGYQRIGRTLLGRKIYTRQDEKRTKKSPFRRAKRWYLKTIYGATIRLMVLVTDEYGDQLTVDMNKAFEAYDRIEIQI